MAEVTLSDGGRPISFPEPTCLLVSTKILGTPISQRMRALVRMAFRDSTAHVLLLLVSTLPARWWPKGTWALGTRLSYRCQAGVGMEAGHKAGIWHFSKHCCKIPYLGAKIHPGSPPRERICGHGHEQYPYARDSKIIQMLLCRKR